MSVFVFFIKSISNGRNEKLDFHIRKIDHFHKNFISNYQIPSLKYCFEFLFAYGVGPPVEETHAPLCLPAFFGLFSAGSSLKIHFRQFPPLLVQTKFLVCWSGGFSYLESPCRSFWHKEFYIIGRTRTHKFVDYLSSDSLSSLEMSVSMFSFTISSGSSLPLSPSSKCSSDCNWTRTHNHFVPKETFTQHLASLAKWFECSFMN